MAEISWAEFERSGWEATVDPYHAFFGPISERVAPVMLEHAHCGPGVRLLDVCCGPGYLAGTAAGVGAYAAGVDIAVNMVSLAARLYPTASFGVADAAALPWPDHSLDGVVCNFGVHHVPNPSDALSEFARVVRSGGRAVFSLWDDSRSRLGVVAEAIYGTNPTIPVEIPAPPPAAEFASDAETRAELHAAGLDLVEVAQVEFAHRFASSAALWESWLASAIRTRPVYQAQSQDQQHCARDAYEAAVTDLVSRDGSVQVPVAVRVVVASPSPAH